MPIATFTESAIYNLTPEGICADLYGNTIKLYSRQTWLSTAIEPAEQIAPLWRTYSEKEAFKYRGIL